MRVVNSGVHAPHPLDLRGAIFKPPKPPILLNLEHLKHLGPCLQRSLSSLEQKLWTSNRPYLGDSRRIPGRGNYVFEFYQRYWPIVVIVAPRVKFVCSFVSLVQTNLGTKSVCNLVTKRSNGFGYTNLDYSRSDKIEKKTKKADLLLFRISFSFP